MYICDNCNNIFEEPARVIFDDHPELDGYKEYKSGCPYCKSICIDDAFVCDRCGEYIPVSQVCYEEDQKLCENCIDEIECEKRPGRRVNKCLKLIGNH